jgi:uncharacterized protein
MANPVTWFEIIGKDSADLHRFYREVFGWKLTPPVKEQGNYAMLEDHEPGMGGGIGEGEARISVYVETADPQPLLDKARRAGAEVLMPVTQITPTTTIAMLRDPAGNTFGLLKSTAPRRTATTRRAAPRTTRARPSGRTAPRARARGSTKKKGRASR